MIGALSYLATIKWMPHAFFLVVFMAAYFRNRNYFWTETKSFFQDKNHPINQNFLVLVIVVVLSLINWITGISSGSSLQDFFPTPILMLCTYLIAISLKGEDAKWLFALVGVESFIAIVSNFYNIPFLSTPGKEGVSNLMYDNRVSGLSSSSSMLATKIFMSWLLFDFFNIKGKVWWVVKGICFLGLMLSFNRSVMMALFFYLGIQLVVMLRQSKRYTKDEFIAMTGLVIPSIVVLVYAIYKMKDSIITQFTRDSGSVSLTGREYVWADFLSFIGDNLLFGNHSVKLWLDGYHAHNSFIQFLATNGLIIFLLFMVLVLRNLNSKNLVFILPIFLLAQTQFTVFWAISLEDIVFEAILFGVVTMPNSNAYLSKE